MRLRLATRNSPLALVQTHCIKQALEEQCPELSCDIVSMTTSGDKLLGMPLATVGGKGLFLKELEQAVLQNKADIAIHSLKDVTVDMPEGLTLASYYQRADARDVLVTPLDVKQFSDLPDTCHIGTASLRRQAISRHLLPHCHITPVRGNLQTRLAKLDRGEVDALILAGAGLLRMGLEDRIRCWLETDVFVPAVGQGTLALACRDDDEVSLRYCRLLDHQPTRWVSLAERAFNQHLQGGCQVPIACYGQLQDESLSLHGLVAAPDGQHYLHAHVQGDPQAAESLGQQLAQRLIEQGAQTILDAVYRDYGS